MTREDFPVAVRMPVAWGHLDAFGHVNNTVYFRFFEDARIACFARIGLDVLMAGCRVGPILARTGCVFRRPLGFPDTVTACARIEDVGVDRFTMIYAVFSDAAGLAAHGDGRIVMLNYDTGDKAPIPPEVRAAIDAL
jgi:acyl-CoA thioester hydrolase